MTASEYFGDWLSVIDSQELDSILLKLKRLYKDKNICPDKSDIFKAFRLCPYNECKAVFIGQDVYPQKGVATGILFGNRQETKEENLSPSLRIIRDASIDLHITHYGVIFDPTLESWARQGILMINSALTCELNKAGSHINMWRPFMLKFLQRFSERTTGIVYVLFGSQAQTLKPYIGKNNHILVTEHPAYYARTGKEMPSSVFYKVNEILYSMYGTGIRWYEE